MEFKDLGSRRVACFHGYHRLTDTLREDCEVLGALSVNGPTGRAEFNRSERYLS
jgi:hypothetical protein